MSDLLLPAERMALTVALAQVGRGESPPPNTSAVIVMALARLAGATPVPWCKTHNHEWTGGVGCIGNRGSERDCQLEDQAVYRIEANDEA